MENLELESVKMCTRCGKIGISPYNFESKCSFCEEIMVDTGINDEEYGDMLCSDSNKFIVWETLQLEKIKSNPKFSQALYEKRLEIEKAEHDEGVRKALEARKGLGTTVSCPYCHSNNVKKVGTSGRLLSVFTFGLASGKVGKQWHCRSCGSDF